MSPQKQSKPSKHRVLSEKDHLILEAIRQNALADSPKEIATVTKLSESTVSKHLRKLRADGYIYTAVNLKNNFGYRALISIDLDLTHMKGPKHGYQNQQEFVRFLKTGLHQSDAFRESTKGIVVEDVYSLLGGRADVCVMASGKDVEAMFAFVTLVIHALPGVKTTNSAAIAMAD